MIDKCSALIAKYLRFNFMNLLLWSHKFDEDYKFQWTRLFTVKC